MNYELAQMLDGSRWLIEPRAFRALIQRVTMATPDAIQAAMVAYANRQVAPTLVGDVAVIEVNGCITYKSSWFSMFFGGGSIQDLQQQFRLALADPAVRTIAFKFDSPGGVVDMVPEFADEIYNARGQKPIIAVADTMIASAAYWLASQVDTIYATTSSQLGSIGVYNEHDDISGMLEKAGIKITLIAHGDHKVDGNPYEPLSDAARADRQAGADEVGDWFETAVARGRGVKKSVVLDTFGQGQVFRGKKAIALGLADKQGTFSQVLSRLTKGRAGVSTAARATILDEVHEHADTTIVDAIAASDKKKATGQCVECGKYSCLCTAPECGPDCPTCSPECGCVQKDAGKASAEKRLADEHAAITAALD
jgi:signal peptide peptidase SppA